MTSSGEVQPLREAVLSELLHARLAELEDDSARAFSHLERAHILGQRITSLHVRAHVAMLRLGWSRRDFREVVGQVSRIFAAALFSRIWVPIGNTGGANVPAMRPMPIPPDLREILDRHDNRH